MWHDHASRELIGTVRMMRARAGMPSLRAIAARAAELGTAMSHTTVDKLFNGTAIPSWDHLAAITAALGGQPDELRGLWDQAQVQRMNMPQAATFEYAQFSCPGDAVAQAYTSYSARGWEPLHLFTLPADPREVQLVMRRPACR